MNVMENKSRIEELLAESLIKFDRLSEKVDGLSDKVDGISDKVEGLSDKVDGLSDKVDGLSTRMTRVEDELVKLNLVSAQNSLSLMELAKDRERIDRLEKTVYK